MKASSSKFERLDVDICMLDAFRDPFIAFINMNMLFYSLYFELLGGILALVLIVLNGAAIKSSKTAC